MVGHAVPVAFEFEIAAAAAEAEEAEEALAVCEAAFAEFVDVATLTEESEVVTGVATLGDGVGVVTGEGITVAVTMGK